MGVRNSKGQNVLQNVLKNSSVLFPGTSSFWNSQPHPKQINQQNSSQMGSMIDKIKSLFFSKKLEVVLVGLENR